jgi:hypothetical protein
MFATTPLPHDLRPQISSSSASIHRLQGLDPGPSLSSPPDVWDALAAAPLSFLQFYPNGGDFEVGDGDAPDLSDDMLQVRVELRGGIF